MKLIDLTDKQFGRLSVIGRAIDKKYNRPHWICRCECGNIIIASGSNLTSENVKSCGCLRKELTINHNKNMGKDIRCQKRKTNKYDLSGEYGIGYFDNGEKFIFDLEDYNLISDYYWRIQNGNGDYKRIVTTHDKQVFTMHKILTGKSHMDHINRNTFDNRKSNLRDADFSQNSQNRTKQSNNTSGVIGVSFDNSSNVWKARINVKKKQHTIYRGTSFEDAVKARLEAEKKYYGEFAPQKHLYEQYNIT